MFFLSTFKNVLLEELYSSSLQQRMRPVTLEALRIHLLRPSFFSLFATSVLNFLRKEDISVFTNGDRVALSEEISRSVSTEFMLIELHGRSFAGSFFVPAQRYIRGFINSYFHCNITCVYRDSSFTIYNSGRNVGIGFAEKLYGS